VRKNLENNDLGRKMKEEENKFEWRIFTRDFTQKNLTK